MARFRSRLPLLLAVGTLVGMGALYVLGMSWLQSRNTTFFDADELFAPRCIDLIILIWLFWFGSAIGSFLNVVAWRMPRGVSINGRSKCPRCETLLKSRDNFPVFGWIALNGRCRTCKLPISPRYPIVEAAVGSSLAAVGVAELYRLAIPGQATHWHGGPFWAPIVDELMIGVLVFHAAMVAVSWAFGLVRIDGVGLPWKLVAFGLLAAIVPILVFPILMIVPWQTVRPSGWSPSGLHVDAMMRILTALVAACLFGRMLARGLCPTADPKVDPLGKGTTRLMDLIVILTIPTIVVGWQAAPAMIVVASLVALLIHKLPVANDMLGSFALAMPIAMTLQIIFWRPLHFSGFWPSDVTSHWVILVAAGIVMISPAWLREAPEAPVAVDNSDSDNDDEIQHVDESTPDSSSET